MSVERTRIMGVLRLDSGDRAGFVGRGVAMIDHGADVVSVLHPVGASPRDERLVLAAVAELSRCGVPVCIETCDAGMALLAAQRGATIVHDMTGASDFFMPRVVREAGLTMIAGCGPFGGVDAPLEPLIRRRVDELEQLGVPRAQLIIEPALTGGDTAQSWRPLLQLARKPVISAPLLFGASRSSLLAALLPEGASADDQEAATVVVSILATRAHAWAVRVHNVARTRAALRTPLPPTAVSRIPSEQHAPLEEPAWMTT